MFIFIQIFMKNEKNYLFINEYSTQVKQRLCFQMHTNKYPKKRITIHNLRNVNPIPSIGIG